LLLGGWRQRPHDRISKIPSPTAGDGAKHS
jgi:hypothetical protein